MKPITETMRWAIEQALHEPTEKRGPKRGTSSYETMINNSLHLCERSNGRDGVGPENLLAALRIISREFDHINGKMLHGCNDMSCPTCDKERLR